MPALNISLPEDLKQRFIDAFPNENRSAILARLIEEAIDRAERERASRAAYERIVAEQAAAPRMDSAAVRKVRRALRKP